MPAKRGRPTKYTEAIASKICARLAAGEALRAICAEKGMPALATVCAWAAEDREGFSNRYARALEARGWLWAEEMVGIADSLEDGADTNRDRLRVDTRKWLLSKLLSKRFGDKVTAEHTGGIEITKIERRIVDSGGPTKDEG